MNRTELQKALDAARDEYIRLVSLPPNAPRTSPEARQWRKECKAAWAEQVTYERAMRLLDEEARRVRGH